MYRPRAVVLKMLRRYANPHAARSSSTKAPASRSNARTPQSSPTPPARTPQRSAPASRPHSPESPPGTRSPHIPARRVQHHIIPTHPGTQRHRHRLALTHFPHAIPRRNPHHHPRKPRIAHQQVAPIPQHKQRHAALPGKRNRLHNLVFRPRLHEPPRRPTHPKRRVLRQRNILKNRHALRLHQTRAAPLEPWRSIIWRTAPIAATIESAAAFTTCRAPLGGTPCTQRLCSSRCAKN
jgi:hypothetical protein